jgi:hypothetical protein
MGVEKFSEFIRLHQPWAILSKKDEKVSAYLRAAQSGEAVIVDAMTHLHAVAARMSFKNKAVAQAKERTTELEQKNFVTGDEFASCFYSPLMTYFLNYKTPDEKVKIPPVAVLVFDKAPFVNPAKQPEQQRRVERSKVTPYDASARIEAGGIRAHANGPLESIDVERLLRSRDVRSSFRRFLLNFLTREDRPLAWSDNARVIVDCEEGVFAWRVDPVSCCMVRCDVNGAVMTEENKDTLVDLSACENTLGEADLAAVTWSQWLLTAYHLAGGVRVISVDTDHAVLQTYHHWCSLLNEATPGFKITWDNDRNIALNLRVFAKSLKTLGYARDTLICVAILSKCDYYEKSLATNMVGHEDLYRGIKDYMQYRKDQKIKGTLAQLSCFRDMLWHIYARKLKIGSGAYLTAEKLLAQRIPQKMTLLVKDADLLMPYLRFKLAYAYFTGFHCWIPRYERIVVNDHQDVEILVAKLQEAAIIKTNK